MKIFKSVPGVLFILSILASCASAPAKPEMAAPQATEASVIAESLPEIQDAEPEIEEPDVALPVPAIPSPPKLLYFYPEPELLQIPKESVPKEPITLDPIPLPSLAPAPELSVQTEKTAPPTQLPKAKAEETRPLKPDPVPQADSPAAIDEKTVEPGIWESEPVPPALSQKEVPVPPSRKVSLSVGQTLEVLYPGSGWVFLGDSSSQNGLGYEKRKLEKNDTLFTFKALKTGDYILEFSRFDVLQDSFSADSIAVHVDSASDKRSERVRAPDYRNNGGIDFSEVNSAADTFSSVLRDEPVLRVTPNDPSSSALEAGTSSFDPESLLKQISASLASNDPSSALSLLTRFFESAVSSLDEAWFLRGQAYEANSPSRDIRKALSAYETLVSAYPDSVRWNEADTRIRYIKQFYLQIR